MSAFKPRLNTEEFIRRARVKHGEKYDYSLVAYVNAHTKVTIICPKHGEFKQPPARHYVSGCNRCGEELTGKKNGMDTEEFIAKSKKVHPGKCDYSKVDYRDNQTNVTIIWKECGHECEQRPGAHLRGSGCHKCVGKGKTTESYIEDAKIVHEGKFDYSKTKYTGAHDKITVICPKHGEFYPTAANHVNHERGCPGCSLDARKELHLDTEEWVKRFKEVHGNRYDYSLFEYKGRFVLSTIICPEHGEFLQTPGNHLDNKGCRKCSDENNPGVYACMKEEKLRSITEAFVYLITLEGESERFIKVGVSVKPKRRFYTMKPYRVVSERILECENMLEAVTIEQRIHEELTKSTYVPEHYFGGHTECFEMAALPRAKELL